MTEKSSQCSWTARSGGFRATSPNVLLYTVLYVYVTIIIVERPTYSNTNFK